MRIRSVSVENFGTIKALDLEFGDGLTLICGPNESGKTTLGRAMWFALTRRATSQAEKIREIEPNTGGTPSVEIELERKNGVYTLEKNFAGQSGSTTLSIDREGILDTYNGEEADEKIRELLGFGEFSGLPPTPNHTGFWPVTWVRQGESGSDPGEKLTEQGNEATVSKVLAEVGGEVLAGADGEDLIDEAREEYERFFASKGTKRTRSGAPLYEAEKRLEEAEEERDRLEKKQHEYEQNLEDFNRLKEQIEELEKEQLPGLEEDTEAARQEYERVEELRGTLDTEKAELESAETKLEQAEDRLDRRTELRDEIDRIEGEVEDLEEEATLKKQDLEAHREQRQNLVRAKGEAANRHQELQSQVDFLGAHLDVLRRQDQLDDLNEDLQTVQEHEEELEDVRENLAGIRVSEEDIQVLEERKQERDRAEVELETAAAQVRMIAHDDVEVAANGDNSTLEAGEESEHLIDEPTTFSVAETLDIEIEPGGEDLASIRSRLEETQQAYLEVLSEHGVESLSEARTMKKEKDDLSAQEERLESLIDQATPDGGREALEEKKREPTNDLRVEEVLTGSASTTDGIIIKKLRNTRGLSQKAQSQIEYAKDNLNDRLNPILESKDYAISVDTVERIFESPGNSSIRNTQPFTIANSEVSNTGETKQIVNNGVELATNLQEPAWITLGYGDTMPNGVAFDYAFPKEAEGRLSVFANGQYFYNIDQRYAGTDVKRTAVVPMGKAPRHIAFRLDAYSDVLAKATVSNVQVGPYSQMNPQDADPIGYRIAFTYTKDGEEKFFIGYITDEGFSWPN